MNTNDLLSPEQLAEIRERFEKVQPPFWNAQSEAFHTKRFQQHLNEDFAALLAHAAALQAQLDAVEEKQLDRIIERTAQLSSRLDIEETVEQFRQRAVAAVREKGEEFRQTADRWQQRAEREEGPFREQSLTDRDYCLMKADASFTYAELLQQLPATTTEGGVEQPKEPHHARDND